MIFYQLFVNTNSYQYTMVINKRQVKYSKFVFYKLYFFHYNLLEYLVWRKFGADLISAGQK